MGEEVAKRMRSGEADRDARSEATTILHSNVKVRLFYHLSQIHHEVYGVNLYSHINVNVFGLGKRAKVYSLKL